MSDPKIKRVELVREKLRLALQELQAAENQAEQVDHRVAKEIGKLRKRTAETINLFDAALGLIALAKGEQP